MNSSDVAHLAPPPALDVARLREEFPILAQQVNGKPLVYLDNAATAQKPRVVIEAERRYYETTNANIHRGVHALSQRATDQYEAGREKVRAFLNARSEREIIFVRGATEGINLVAASLGSRFGPGDEIVVTELEHHSNIVPWQMLCQSRGTVLKVVPINDAGEVDQAVYESLLGPRTRLVAVSHMSNALGTVNPVARMVAAARRHGIPVLLDGAQAAPHIPVDVQALDCDFYVFSGHKLYGPTGVGVLYGREALLKDMPPWQGGGDMIAQVSFKGSTWARLPAKFEAGTPHIAGGIVLGTAIDWVNSVGLAAIAAHEQVLLEYATRVVGEIPGLKLIGTAREKASILAFTLDGVHPHDIGTILDHHGVAIRAGHHCAMPVMERYGLPATARASFAAYNTLEEVDTLVAALRHVHEVFG